MQVKYYYTFVFHGAQQQDKQSLTSISCKVTAITVATSKSHHLAVGWALIHPLKYIVFFSLSLFSELQSIAPLVHIICYVPPKCCLFPSLYPLR